MPDILRTYGTLNTMYLIFYPYTIPNGMIFNKKHSVFENEYE